MPTGVSDNFLRLARREQKTGLRGAAIGLTEETDAVCVVVSEETGAISVSVYGKLTRDLDEEGLRRVLKSLFRPEERGRAFLDYVQQRFRFTGFTKRDNGEEKAPE